MFKRGKGMNLTQFAKITGYSVSTVSKAFSDSPDISEMTKNSILQKAKELGIYPKYNKKFYDKKVISVICPELSSAYFADLIAKINKEIESYNATTIISVTDFSAKKEAEMIEFFSSRKISDGIIVLRAQTTIKKIHNVPIVCYDSLVDNPFVDVFNYNMQTGINEAVKLFKNMNHKKIAFIGEKLTLEKVPIFKKAMDFYNMNIDESLIRMSEKRFEEAGFSEMSQLFESGNLPTAILASYDYIALGVIDCIKKHGKRIPQDFSVIGVDDINMVSHYNISLTSINTGVDELYPLMIKAIFDKINNPLIQTTKKISVRSQLIVRNSVAKKTTKKRNRQKK